MQPGKNPAQVFIACLAPYQQDQVLVGPVPGVSGEYVAAADGLDTCLPGQPGEVDQAPQAVDLGEGQVAHAQGLGPVDEGLEGGRPLHPGVPGVDVEVAEQRYSSRQSWLAVRMLATP